ncbi:MAG: hypothetical protein ABI670_03540 [Chloroflexota bacterium]
MRAIRNVAAVVALIALAFLVSGGKESRAATEATTTVYPLMDVGCGCLLGGTSGGKWISTDAMSSTVKSGQKYRVYTLKGYLGQATGSAAESMGVPCEEEREVTIKPAYKGDIVVASGGPWAAMPRVPKSLGANQPVYVKAVSDLLKARGIASPRVKIEQIVQIDLEGDRVNEVLVSASYFGGSDANGPTPSAEAGDYSILFMRKVINGKLETIVLADGEYPQPLEFAAPLKYTLGGVLDLNGDGVMEIVVHSEYYEGLSSSVFQVNGAQVEEVLFCGCGA